ncbi:PREDICTED: bifunctional methylenetetrahydrofolate dehydrogenase/cyclohydrolase, mitochondrial [Nicrophorus vespilloides]|uniref:methenyltetrahydrofolate cyclohydrolase n=1 Tax=Nicrophorus vespilloides TaxID=110193 RepID=A0ABM1MD60_NICVS|nr:PREDICTED: bifunctional methylenetetrahydrofolate dehydrogenase/cyclohydrolase, mitochondrial [Nicrophorus vespilloides]
MMNNKSATLIDGKRISDEYKKGLKVEIEQWMSKGNRAPCLKAILVGEDPASRTYVTKKMEASAMVGIDSETINLPSSISQEELMEKIVVLNQDKQVDGILVQLPLPKHIDERTICNTVDVDKDVDGFHITNIGKLALNMDTFIPCTVLAVLELIKCCNIETKGKTALICGRSKNIGLPLSMILHSDYRNELPGLEATTIMCHRNTPASELMRYAPTADILISATGVVGLIKPEMVKPGAVVIDVGLTRVQMADGKTKLVGDVEFEGASKVAGYITPVPGGVGPMTVAMLMKNTFKAAKHLAQ